LPPATDRGRQARSVDDDAVAAHRKHLGELVNLATLLDGAPQLEFLEKLAG